jgi:Tfp pilus assembly protein PilX
MRRAERGVVLLEILAAVVILTAVGLSLVALTAAGARATATVSDREHEQMDEDRLLAAYSLLGRGDLDLRLGSRSVGPYVVAVERPEPALYRVAVSEQRSPAMEDLVTIVYRPAPSDAP